MHRQAVWMLPSSAAASNKLYAHMNDFGTSRLQRYSCLRHSMAQRIHIRLYTSTTTSAKHWKILEDPVRLQAIQLRQLWESLIRNGQCLDSAPWCTWVSGMNSDKTKDTIPTTAKDRKATAKPRRLAKMPASSELKMAPTLKDACGQAWPSTRNMDHMELIEL